MTADALRSRADHMNNGWPLPDVLTYLKGQSSREEQGPEGPLRPIFPKDSCPAKQQPMQHSWFPLKHLAVVVVAFSLLLAPARVGAQIALDQNAVDSLATLPSNTPPYRDEVDLARRFRYSCGAYVPSSVTWNPTETVGSSRSFWVLDEPKRAYFRVTATLRHTSDHLLMYVEDGATVSSSAIEASVDRFETRTLPALERTFGELPPGLRLTVFNGRVPGVGGYFSSGDMLPWVVKPYSNQRPMIYMNTQALPLGRTAYHAVLAHEVQHVIHYFAQPQQESWINEGASEVAMAVAGFVPTGSVNAFRQRPDTQLDSWANQPSRSLPHYGAAYLFVTYVAERLGQLDLLRDLIATDGIGIALFDRFLAAREEGITFAGLFRDWVVANVVNDRTIDAGQYGYTQWRERMRPSEVWRDYSERRSAAVSQHAAHYIEVQPPRGEVGSLAVRFQGDATVRLAGTNPYQGTRIWASYSADNSESFLARRLDLRDVARASLTFALWYDTEADYDYAYVAVSTDDGCTWETLPGEHTTTTNPVGSNLGYGYTGRSGPGDEPVWVQETIDLSRFAGRAIWLRFQYVTDQSYHGAGVLLDNVRIPEIGFTDGAEWERAGWDAAGFRR